MKSLRILFTGVPFAMDHPVFLFLREQKFSFEYGKLPGPTIESLFVVPVDVLIIGYDEWVRFEEQIGLYRQQHPSTNVLVCITHLAQADALARKQIEGILYEPSLVAQLESFLRQAALVKRLFELINEQQSAMEKHRASLEEVNKKIENWVGDLEADFSIANAVQRALIPQRFPDLKHIRFQGYFRPGFSRGGDFFDVFSFRERGEVGLIHLDSAGHSLLSGLVSALMKISASQEGAHVTHPVDGMVSSIAASLSPVMELTKMTARMRVGALDPKRLQFEFCDFDMGALYQVHADGRAPSKIQTSTAEAFKGTASLAGLSHKSVQCAPGDVLLFPSDGCDSVVSDMLDILKKRRGDDLLEVRNELAFLIQDPDLKAEDDASFILAQISPQALQLISS